MSARCTALILLALVLLGGALRIGLAFNENVLPDGDLRGNRVYREAAENILGGEGYHWRWYFGLGERWANRPPGYALLVAGVLSLGGGMLGLALVQSLLGALTAVPAFLLGRRIAGRGTGIFAAALVAVYPYYVVNDSALSENVLFTHLTAWSLLAVHRLAYRPGVAAGVGAGVLAGLTALVRVTWAAAVPLIFLWVLLVTPRRRRAAVMLGAVAVPCFLAVCLPWLVRNYERFGSISMALDTGRALWNGNNPHTLSRYPAYSIDQSEARAWMALPAEVRKAVMDAPDEAHADRIFRDLAVENIRRDPGAALHRARVKVGAFFSLWLNPGPVSDAKRYAHLLSYGAVLLLGVPGLILRGGRRRDYLLGLLAIFAAAAVSAVFWGQTRFRVPMDWFLFIPAGVTTRALWAWMAAGGDPAGSEEPATG